MVAWISPVNKQVYATIPGNVPGNVLDEITFLSFEYS